jgi:site-specific DNA recombinase
MKIAIYARVSSETQAHEGTINSQLELLRSYAKTNNLDVIEECIDDGYSGTDLIRPGLDRVRDLASQQMIEGILILSPDRLTRNNTHYVILQEEFTKRNIQLIYTNHQSCNTPEDKLLLGMQSLFSEYERTKILDRTRRGRIHNARQGHLGGGGVPYGYRRINKSNGAPAHMEIIPEEAEVVRLIFRLTIKDKYSLLQISKYLSGHGYPTRNGNNTWATSTIGNILNNECYTGTSYACKLQSVDPKHPRNATIYRKRKHSTYTIRPHEDWIPIPVPAIIDRSIWECSRSQLSLNSKLAARNNWKNKYLLRTLVTCGFCGSHISGKSHSGKIIYRCDPWAHRKSAIPHEENVSVPRDTLDNLVWNSIIELVNDPKKLRTLIKARQAGQGQPNEHTQSELDSIASSLKRLSSEEERLLEAYRSKVISLEQLKGQLQKLTTKRTLLENQNKELVNQQHGQERPIPTLNDLGVLSIRLQRAMARSDFPTRQRIVQALINSVTLYPKRAVISGVLPLNGHIPKDGHLLLPQSSAAACWAFGYDFLFSISQSALYEIVDE